VAPTYPATTLLLDWLAAKTPHQITGSESNRPPVDYLRMKVPWVVLADREVVQVEGTAAIVNSNGPLCVGLGLMTGDTLTRVEMPTPRTRPQSFVCNLEQLQPPSAALDATAGSAERRAEIKKTAHGSRGRPLHYTHASPGTISPAHQTQG
jgi:hypothetical protein